MNTSRILKILAILAVTGLFAGCKLAVMVPSGGDVTSSSGTRNCTGGSLCEHNITDSTFNDSFTAVAKPGYVFTKWSAGPGFLCANSVSPTCVINNTGLPQGNAGIDAVIAGGSFFYAMPLFDFVGIDTDSDGVQDHVDADDDNDGILDEDDQCPLAGPSPNDSGCPAIPDSDALLVNGKVWAQPDLFNNLTWNQMDAICPSTSDGICNGILNGYDMTGWIWASPSDTRDLLLYFYATADGTTASSTDCVVITRFFTDGWRATISNEPEAVRAVYGRTTNQNVISHLREGEPGRCEWSWSDSSEWAGGGNGGWFHRSP